MLFWKLSEMERKYLVPAPGSCSTAYRVSSASHPLSHSQGPHGAIPAPLGTAPFAWSRAKGRGGMLLCAAATYILYLVLPGLLAGAGAGAGAAGAALANTRLNLR